MKWITGYEGHYKIDKNGNIYSYKINVEYKDGRIGNWPKKKLKQGLNHKGYPIIYLSKNSKKKTFAIHRLVAMSFVENPCSKKQINHKNGIKTDNRASNLEWCSNSENQIHAWKTGLQPTYFRKIPKGENRPNAKMTDKKVIECRKLHSTGMFSYNELAKKYKVKMSTISDVCKYRTWKHIARFTGNNN